MVFSSAFGGSYYFTNLAGTGTTYIDADGTLYQLEQANAQADLAGYGQWWVNDDSPNRPMFTNDEGTDLDIIAVNSATTTSGNLLVADGSNFTSATILSGDYTFEGDLDGNYTMLVGGGDNSSITASKYLKGYNGQLYTSTLGINMPRAGSITDIGCTLNAVLGLATTNWDLQVRVNGSNVFSCNIDTASSGNKKCRAKQARGTDTFSAGDVLTVYISEAVNGSTVEDVQCGVWGFFDD
jgi:hypothetical protein